jgi:hypothetical protein
MIYKEERFIFGMALEVLVHGHLAPCFGAMVRENMMVERWAGQGCTPHDGQEGGRGRERERERERKGETEREEGAQHKVLLPIPCSQ